MSPKTIILTGASRGIGHAIALNLLKKSHNLVLLARTEAPLRKLEERYSKQVAVLTGDLADFSFGEKAVKLAVQKFGSIDGVIVNHGVLDPVKRVGDSTVEEWRKAFDVNFFSAVGLTQAALPELRKSRGCIVLVSSGAASNAYVTWGAYGSAKAALNHLAATLGSEEKDVTTLSIRPGVVDTEMQREIREVHHERMETKDKQKFAELKSSGSLLKPEQPGDVVAACVVAPPRDLSGKFMSWDGEELQAYRK
ncbi:hypothetical protein LTR62_000665 [Meristemomyces frigidus]|uniref:Ketoreductase domain-containing protein n=1 Tax=Meristemomyces frigidus TaxID=1508187 RepID=A0AAN7TA42_9PEZI|nr:hypothetical protein LTR62_000665 [Meristemomyces frigidus]